MENVGSCMKSTWISCLCSVSISWMDGAPGESMGDESLIGQRTRWLIGFDCE